MHDGCQVCAPLKRCALILCLGLLSLAPVPGVANRAIADEGDWRRILRVGPERELKLPSEAALIARDNDVVEIDAGVYRGDVAVWTADNLVLRSARGRVHLDAEGQSAGGKATWVIQGRDTTVEGIEFSGSRVRHHNGAGIRLEGPGLTLRHCYFHNNQMGILTGGNAESDILIEHSEFARNTVDYAATGRLGHNIYIGNVRSFTLRFSQVHSATTGHNVKSRARFNRIEYNRIMDERRGGSSYLVDLANGGFSVILGNVLHQGTGNQNNRMISYAAEGATNPDQRLFVVHNTMANDDHNGVFVQNRGTVPAVILNNLFVGEGRVAAGPAVVRSNLLARSSGGEVGRLLFADEETRQASTEFGNRWVPDTGLLDQSAFDYRLSEDSPAIDQAAPVGSAGGIDLAPTHEYASPGGVRPRVLHGRPDLGAYEYREP